MPIAQLTVSEAATILDLDESVVKRYIYAGRLVAEKHAGRWFIDPDSVAELAKEERKPGPKPSNPETS